MFSFISFYQNIPLHVRPEIFNGLPIRWYSLAYIVAFALVIILTHHRRKTESKYKNYNQKVVDDALTYIVIGTILGARLGFVLFYDPGYYLSNPLEIFLPFSMADGFHFTGISGMSYHGGVIGIPLILFYYCRTRRLPFTHFIEMFIPTVPIGYMFGRIGNFMNGELYGRITNVPWGMYFYQYAGSIKKPYPFLRHPSQLYEAFFEGLILFLILWLPRKKINTNGYLTAMYLGGYGIFRFIIEFFREPDDLFKNPGNAAGTVIGMFTMGQVLCVLMIISAVSIFYVQ